MQNCGTYVNIITEENQLWQFLWLTQLESVSLALQITAAVSEPAGSTTTVLEAALLQH